MPAASAKQLGGSRKTAINNLVVMAIADDTTCITRQRHLKHVTDTIIDIFAQHGLRSHHDKLESLAIGKSKHSRARSTATP